MWTLPPAATTHSNIWLWPCAVTYNTQSVHLTAVWNICVRFGQNPSTPHEIIVLAERMHGRTHGRKTRKHNACDRQWRRHKKSQKAWDHILRLICDLFLWLVYELLGEYSDGFSHITTPICSFKRLHRTFLTSARCKLFELEVYLCLRQYGSCHRNSDSKPQARRYCQQVTVTSNDNRT